MKIIQIVEDQDGHLTALDAAGNVYRQEYAHGKAHWCMHIPNGRDRINRNV